MIAYIYNLKIQGTPDEIIQFLEVYKMNMEGGDTINIKGWDFQDNVQYCETCMPGQCDCTTKKVNTMTIQTDGQFIPNDVYFKT